MPQPFDMKVFLNRHRLIAWYRHVVVHLPEAEGVLMRIKPSSMGAVLRAEGIDPSRAPEIHQLLLEVCSAMEAMARVTLEFEDKAAADAGLDAAK